ncbi:MAG: hypothetical protein J6U17_06065 [Kiritimatiellae bacterium]|nr:hypothetical protein [Kiritimatiellia bacterium]
MKMTAMLAAIAVSAAAFASVKVESGRVSFSGPATADEVSAARAEFSAKSGRNGWASVRLASPDDATLEAAVAAFPVCRQFTIDSASVTSYAPLAKLKRVKKLEIMNSEVSDLSPVAGVASVEELSLYGSSVKDFSPLAKCSKLRTLNCYATCAAPEVYDTLGAIGQMKSFQGGLSGMKSLEWVRRIAGLEEIQLFAEDVRDFSPVSTLAALRRFRAWNMDGEGLSAAHPVAELGDLSFLAPCRNLEILELPGSVCRNFASLSSLPRLKRVVLSGARRDVDLSFLAACQSLETLDVSVPGATVTGFAALANHPSLRYCNFAEAGPIDLSFVRTCPAVTTLNISGSDGMASEITDFDAIAGAPSLVTLDMRNVRGCTLTPLATCPKLANVTLTKGAFLPEGVRALEEALRANNVRAMVVER